MAHKLYRILKDENPFKKLYTWESPERHWFPKNQMWYISYSLFFVSIIFLMALLGEYLFIVTILAFVFLWFVQGATKPQVIEHTVTSLGIRTFGNFYKWKNIKHFWFSQKSNVIYINLEVFEDVKPEKIKRISLLLNEGVDFDLFKIFIKHVDYSEKQEINFNPITQLINGEYFEAERYIEKDETSFNEDQET